LYNIYDSKLPAEGDETDYIQALSVSSRKEPYLIETILFLLNVIPVNVSSKAEII